MTEAEWLASTEPEAMLEFLQGKASDRKLRLFAVACCRRIWHLLTDKRSRKAVEVAERFADGHRRPRGLSRVDKAAVEAAVRFSPAETALFSAAKAALFAVRSYPPVFAEPFSSYSPRFVYMMVRDALAAAGAAAGAVPSEQSVQAALLRDLFGNPFRPITINPAWLSWHDGLLVSMARRMYDSRDFSDMPVLADALEEAGCDNAEILSHCRQPGEHVRGCWIVDLLLGKE